MWPTNADWNNFLDQTGRVKHLRRPTPREAVTFLLQNTLFCSIMKGLLEKSGVTYNELTDERWWENVRERAIDLYKT